MRSLEECNWCKTTPHIERKISKYMPEEYKHRCSACHEQFWEEHSVCDICDCLIHLETDAEGFLESMCSVCRSTNPFIVSQTTYHSISKAIDAPGAPGALTLKEKK